MKTLKNVILPRIPEGEEEISRWREALLELNEELRLQVYEDIYELNNKSKMRCRKTTPQAIPHNTDTTVLFDSVPFDTLNEYTSANGRFTATKEGYYQVNATVLSESVAWSIGEWFECRLYKNGSLYSVGFFNEAIVTGTYYMYNSLSDLVLLSSEEYIEIRVKHTQGGDVGIYPNGNFNYFSVHRI